MCNCKSSKSINGMKKFSSKKIVDSVIPVGMAAVGYGGARIVEKFINTTDAAKKNTIVGAVQLAAGIFMTTQKNEHIRSAGFGVALAGANAFLANPIAKALDSIGIKGLNGIGYPSRSYASDTQMSGIGCSKILS